MDNKEINWNELWKLPDDLKDKVVKGKTPYSKKTGDLSFYIAKALCRLPTHREMRAIAKHVHPSTKYKPFDKAITAYLKSSQKTKNKVVDGKVHIMDLMKEDIELLSQEDKKNISRYNKAKSLQNNLKLLYKDLKYFMEGTPEDREYLKDFLKPEKIHYLASVISCIRKEELFQALIKNAGVKDWGDF